MVVVAINSGRQLSSQYQRILSCGRSTMIMKFSTKAVDASLLRDVNQKYVWNSPVGTLKGVGPVMIDTLEQLGIATIADALFHFPTSIIDRRNRIRLSQASIGDLITVELKVTAIEQGFGGRPHLIVCMDMDGSPLEVRYFCSPTMTLMKWSEIKREYKVNSDIILSGKLTLNKYSSNHEVVNPEILLSLELPEEYINQKFGVEPVYGLTKGLTNSKFRTIIKSSLEKISKTAENDWMLEEYRMNKNWPTFLDSINQIHRPDCMDEVHENCVARTRLAFDDFVSQFLHQLQKEKEINIANSEKLQNLRNSKANENCLNDKIESLNEVENENEIDLLRTVKSYSVTGNGFYSKILEEILPFSLTNCQKKAIIDINTEIALKNKMSRLLQGDVGSGKTLVAVLAILTVIENNQQSAILAPTELLAKQHYNVISKYFDSISDQVDNQRNEEEWIVEDTKNINNFEVKEKMDEEMSNTVSKSVDSNFASSTADSSMCGEIDESGMLYGHIGKNIPRRRLRVELLSSLILQLSYLLFSYSPVIFYYQKVWARPSDSESIRRHQCGAYNRGYNL